MRAAALTAALLLAPAASAQIIGITDVNPNTTNSSSGAGGRINGIAVDPTNKNIMYAASEYGGLFKSVNGGLNWFALPGHVPVVTWDVEVNPANPLRVYATSFYDGRNPSRSGINVSADGGITWGRPLTAVPPPGLCANPADQTELSAFGIAIDRANPNRIYIGTSCGLAISDDAGDTWAYTAPALGSGHRVWDVVSAVPNIPDVCGDNGHYWIVNGAWFTGSGLPMGRCSLAASPYFPDPPSLIATVNKKVFEAPTGINWQETRENPAPQGRVPFVETNKRSGGSGALFDLWFGDVGVHRVTCDGSLAGIKCGTGNTPAWQPPYTCHIGGQACTTNAQCPEVNHNGNHCYHGGYSWKWGGHVDMGSIAFDPTAATDACPLINANDGGVYVNTLAQSPGCQDPFWQQPTVTPHALLIYTAAGADLAGTSDDHIIFGTQDNGMFLTTNAKPDSPFYWTPTGGDTFTTMASSENGGTFMHTNGGQSYTKVSNDAWNGAAMNAYPPTGGDNGFKFTKMMAKWGPKSYALLTVDYTPTNGTYTDGGLYVTENIDAVPISWSELGNSTEPQQDTIGTCSDYPPRQCTIGGTTCGGAATCNKRTPCAVYTAGNAAIFYVQTGDCNGDGFTDELWAKYTTQNASWTKIVLPNGRGVGVVAVDPNDANRLYVSAVTPNDAPFYVSTNGGLSWAPLNNLNNIIIGGGEFPIKNQRGYTYDINMPGYLQPSFIAVDPFDGDNLIAGGRDSGVFYSIDRGETWTRVTDPVNPQVSGRPHIPRPKHAYFSESDHDKSIFVASQGKGLWRLDVCRADPSEPDDTPATAKTYAPGPERFHSLCGTGDVDYVKFTVTQSTSMTLATLGNVGGHTTLRLLNSSLQQIDFSDHSPEGPYASIERTCQAGSALTPGTYYVAIEDFQSNDTLDLYSLEISGTPCCGDGNVNADEPCDGSACCTGWCTFADLGTACDDGDVCTAVSACNATHQCQGALSGPPSSVTAAFSGTSLTWPADIQATGYDVVMGSLDLLRATGGNFSIATAECEADNAEATSVDLGWFTPPPGTAYFFLVRGVNCTHQGPFTDLGDPTQVGFRDDEILASGVSCVP